MTTAAAFCVIVQSSLKMPRECFRGRVPCISIWREMAKDALPLAGESDNAVRQLELTYSATPYPNDLDRGPWLSAED